MKSIILVGLIGLVVAHPTYEPVTTNYHAEIGIKEAARIKALEEAIDFDGSKVVGGSAAPVGRHPWLGGLLITLTGGQTSVCGSSLISPIKLVTAAHCWYDGQNQARLFEVVLGSVRLFSGGVRVSTSDVKTHENWNPINLGNDMAIITIRRVEYTNVIQAIGLPSGSAGYVGSWAWAAGFGKQSDYGGISTNQVIHHAQVQVISNAVCRYTFGNVVTDGNICTDGSNYQSPCSGDSGGPLAVTEGNPILIGVVSFGAAAGCERGHPAAYSRTSHFKSWIQRHM